MQTTKTKQEEFKDVGSSLVICQLSRVDHLLIRGVWNKWHHVISHKHPDYQNEDKADYCADLELSLRENAPQRNEDVWHWVEPADHNADPDKVLKDHPSVQSYSHQVM